MKKIDMNKLNAYLQLTRFDKSIGILLLLWPTLWGLWLAAGGIPPLKILLIFIAGVIVMRPAGCIINDIADRNFDGKVTRTKSRPLATGAVSLKEASILFVILCLIGLILVLQLNWLTIGIAAIALLLSSIYPFTKRYIYFPQLILGLAWYLAVPMAFAAILNKITLLAWLTYITVVLWTVIFDTMYAIADREDDLKIGIKSFAVLLGKYDRLVIGIMQVIFLSLLIFIGITADLRWPYYLSLIIVSFLMIYQHTLIYTLQPMHCIKAFKSNHWLGMFVFLGIIFSC